MLSAGGEKSLEEWMTWCEVSNADAISKNWGEHQNQVKHPAFMWKKVYGRDDREAPKD